jgi:hypothetical protein
MRGLLVRVVAALGLGPGGMAPGAEPQCRWRPWRWPWSTPHPPCPCCPDDCCPKKLAPCPPRVSSHAPDDYCPKTLPCVCPVKCCGKDDYCPKPCRIYLPPCYPPWYTCGPGPGCGRCKGVCPKSPEPP